MLICNYFITKQQNKSNVNPCSPYRQVQTWKRSQYRPYCSHKHDGIHLSYRRDWLAGARPFPPVLSSESGLSRAQMTHLVGLVLAVLRTAWRRTQVEQRCYDINFPTYYTIFPRGTLFVWPHRRSIIWLMLQNIILAYPALILLRNRSETAR